MNKLVDKLKEIVFEDAESSNAKRENANVDGNSAMGTMLQIGSTAAKELATSIVSEEAMEAHNRGNIHIHDLDFLVTGTTTCSQIDLDKLFTGGFNTGHGFIREPQDIKTYANLSAIAIQANQNDQHGGQSIPSYDHYLAPGVLKTFRKKMRYNIMKYIEITLNDYYFETKENEELLIPALEKMDTIKPTYEEMEVVGIELMEDLKEIGIEVEDPICYARNMMSYAVIKSEEETDRDTQQAMEAFVHNLNTMHSRAGAQVPFSSINFGTDTTPEGRMVTKNLLKAIDAGLGNGETAIFPIAIFKVKEGVNYNKDDVNYDLFKQAMEVSSRRLFPNFSFIDAPFNLSYYEEGNFDSEISYMGCRTRTIANRHGAEEVTGRGNVSFTSVNLPRIAIEIKRDNKAKSEEELVNLFMEELENTTTLVIEQLYDRFEYQISKKVKNFPFLAGQGIWKGSEELDFNDTLEEMIKQGSLTVGFIGLAETLTVLIGEHHGESEKAQELGLKIISRMRELVDEASEEYDLNYALIATPAEGLSGRFTNIDRDRYGVIEGVTDREYYTNSFHIPVYYNIPAYKKIELEAPYHALTNGGHISYIEVDGSMRDNPEAFESIIRAMKEAGVGYGSINHPVDRDPVCGYSGIIGDVCPGCGRKETDKILTNSGKENYIKFDRIRRITGYLVGTVDRFNDGKAAEERDRVKHL